MHSEVSVKLAANQEYRFDLEGAEPMAHEAGRRWLDDQFIALDCEPLRASGKVLLADKVLTVAVAAGAPLLSDATWLAQFARASVGAVVRVGASHGIDVVSGGLQPSVVGQGRIRHVRLLRQ